MCEAEIEETYVCASKCHWSCIRDDVVIYAPLVLAYCYYLRFPAPLCLFQGCFLVVNECVRMHLYK